MSSYTTASIGGVTVDDVHIVSVKSGAFLRVGTGTANIDVFPRRVGESSRDDLLALLALGHDLVEKARTALAVFPEEVAT